MKHLLRSSSGVWAMLALLACGLAGAIWLDQSPAARGGEPKPGEGGGGGFKAFTQKVPKTTMQFDMVPVKGGTVEMELPDKDGKPAKQKVTVKDLYWGKYEVTWDNYMPWRLVEDRPDLKVDERKDYEALARPSPSYGLQDHGWGTEGFPILHVSYHAAKTYCVWLSDSTGRKYRLPTEAEWQYACMAGGKEVKTEEELKKVAWYVENSGADTEDKEYPYQERTHRCGTKLPNAFGLYDMLGNVAEWVVPADGEKWAKLQGKERGTRRTYMTGVLKGGSYLTQGSELLGDKPGQQSPSTFREVYKNDWQESDPQDPKSHWLLSDASYAGFRVVCEP